MINVYSTHKLNVFSYALVRLGRGVRTPFNHHIVQNVNSSHNASNHTHNTSNHIHNTSNNTHDAFQVFQQLEQSNSHLVTFIRSTADSS